MQQKRDVSASDVEFVPFSLEAGGVWGPAARKFFRTCVTVPITSADDGLKWRFRALYPEGAASRGACVSYMALCDTL